MWTEMTRKPQMERKYPKIKPKILWMLQELAQLEKKYPKIKLKNPLDAPRVGIT